MKFKSMLLMALVSGLPGIIKPMWHPAEEPSFEELIELAQRKEMREKESSRFRRRRRELLEKRARQASIATYWSSIQKAIAQGGIQELTNTAEAEGLDISVKRKDPNGNTILHYAAEFDNPAVIEEYVVNDISPDPVNNEGLTPLMIAARKGNITVASKLLDKGAKVNVATKRSRTYPLFEAVNTNNWNIVAILLDHGAKINFKGPADYSVLEYLEILKDIEGLKKLSDILHSLKPTKQRTQWIDQITHIIEQIEQKELESEWTLIERETKQRESTPILLEQRAHEAAEEALLKKEPSLWKRIFGT